MEEQFGPYRLEELIGRGGMGEVHRAVDTVKQRTVAVKRLAPHLASDVEFQSRFRHESAVAARLREAHVIPIHDYGEIEGRLYIDMRLVDGVDLDTVVTTQGALAPSRAVRIVAQVASALDAAHEDGLVHRDVKPSNVLLGANDFAYLVDFGIAAPMSGSRLTVTGTALGTMAYMAPELFEEHRRDSRIDVYSLACMLHKLLTGRRPFEADGLMAMMRAHLTVPPPRPSLISGVAATFDDVVARGMAKNPDDRYRSAGELAEAARMALSAEFGHQQWPVSVGLAPSTPRGLPMAGVSAPQPVVVTPQSPTTAQVPSMPRSLPPTSPGRPPAAPAATGRRGKPLLVAGAALLVAALAVAGAVTVPRLVAAATTVVGVAGPAPEAATGSVHADPGGRFTIGAPAGWARSEVQVESFDVFFTSVTPGLSATGEWYNADLGVRATPSTLDLNALVAKERARLEALPSGKLTLNEAVTLPDGTPARLLASTHNDAEFGFELNNLVLVASRNGLNVVAAGSGLSNSWETDEPVIDAALRTLTLGSA
ncbi:serine/threonine-protein kinase [Actinomycetes bacterium KLBMP 9759]